MFQRLKSPRPALMALRGPRELLTLQTRSPNPRTMGTTRGVQEGGSMAPGAAVGAGAVAVRGVGKKDVLDRGTRIGKRAAASRLPISRCEPLTNLEN
jgi:hypothetical protein